MKAEDKLNRVREIIEELDSIPFIASEQGLGESERDCWEGRLWVELRGLIGSRQTCVECGAKYQGPPVDECPGCFGNGVMQ